MNILYIALLLCVVRHVFASGSDALDVDKQLVPLGVVGEKEDIATNPNVRGFVEAVQEGDMPTAHIIFESCDSDKLKEYCGKHLVNLGMSRLVELINGTVSKSRVVQKALLCVGQELFDEIFAKIEPTKDISCEVACSSANLASNTDELLYILGKLTGKDQERVVGFAATAFVYVNKLEIFDHMLSALESKPSLGPSMANIAIRKGFEFASIIYNDGGILVARYFDHPAILAGDFATALYRLYSVEDPKNVVFYRLLAQADRQDLEEARNKERFPDRSPEFQDAVNEALKVVGTEARIGVRRRRIELFLMDLLPKDLLDIIFGYYFE